MISETELLGLIEGLRQRELRRWCRRGWVRPDRDAGRYLFHDIDIARVRLIREIRVDMRINEEAVPVVLSLLDQVYDLRRRLRALCEAVHDQPEEVRRRILERIAEPAED